MVGVGCVGFIGFHCMLSLASTGRPCWEGPKKAGIKWSSGSSSPMPLSGTRSSSDPWLFQDDDALTGIPIHRFTRFGMQALLEPGYVAGSFFPRRSTWACQSFQLHIGILPTTLAPKDAPCEPQVVAVVHPGLGTKAVADRLIQLLLVVLLGLLCGAPSGVQPIQQGTSARSTAAEGTLPVVVLASAAHEVA